MFKSTRYDNHFSNHDILSNQYLNATPVKTEVTVSVLNSLFEQIVSKLVRKQRYFADRLGKTHRSSFIM